MSSLSFIIIYSNLWQFRHDGMSRGGGGGGHSQYMLVGVCRSTSKKGGGVLSTGTKKGGLRHGHNPKKGGLRHGHESK